VAFGGRVSLPVRYQFPELAMFGPHVSHGGTGRRHPSARRRVASAAPAERVIKENNRLLVGASATGSVSVCSRRRPAAVP
jgi:hypothetical protein